MLKRPANSSFGDSKFARGVSLRTKTFVGIFLVCLLLVAAAIVVVTRALTSSFQEIQSQLSFQRVERVVSQFRQLAKIRALYAKDNSEWDDAYAFITGELPGFLEYNYSSEGNASGLQMVVAFDRNYAVIGRVVAGDEAIFETVDLDAVAESGLLGNEGACGFFQSPDGIFLISVHPVNTSERTDPSPGWLAFIQPLNEDKLQDLSELSGVSLSINSDFTGEAAYPANGVATDVESALLGKIRTIVPEASVLSFVSQTPLNAWVFLPSAVGDGAVVFDVRLPQSLFATAYRVERTIIIASVVAAIAFLVFCQLSFELIVLRRVIALDQDLRAITDSHDNSDRKVRVIGDDEIGSLAESANRMLSALAHEHAITAAEHELLVSVLDAVDEGVLALRPVRNSCGEIIDFSVVSSNAAADQLCGTDDNGDLNRGLLDFCPQIRGLPAFGDYLEVIGTGVACSREFLCPGFDPPRWIRHAVAPWGDGLVVCFEDVTGRKNNEGALAESLDELTRLTTAMMGREDRILELKEEVNALNEKLGQPAAYGREPSIV